MRGNSGDLVGAVSGILTEMLPAILRPAKCQKLQRKLKVLRAQLAKERRHSAKMAEAEKTVLSELEQVKKQLALSQGAHTGASIKLEEVQKALNAKTSEADSLAHYNLRWRNNVNALSIVLDGNCDKLLEARKIVKDMGTRASALIREVLSNSVPASEYRETGNCPEYLVKLVSTPIPTSFQTSMGTHVTRPPLVKSVPSSFNAPSHPIKIGSGDEAAVRAAVVGEAPAPEIPIVPKEIHCPSSPLMYPSRKRTRSAQMSTGSGVSKSPKGRS